MNKLKTEMKKTMADIEETKARLKTLKEKKADIIEKQKEIQKFILELAAELHEEVKQGKYDQCDAVKRISKTFDLPPHEALKKYLRGISKRKK